MKNNNGKLKSQYAFKRGAYATLLTVIIVVAVVGVNILLTLVSQKFPISLDLTSDVKNTLSKENSDYIETIDKEINIYSVGSEDDYESGYIRKFLQNYFYWVDESGYITQTATLLKEYPKHNSNINVKFLDASSKDFENISANYSDYSYGDIFVECTFKVGDKDITRRKHVSYDDIYSYDTQYASYGYYAINGSNLENAIASAIYSVTASKTVTLGVPTEYCGSSETFLRYLGEYLEDNNYEIKYIDGFDIKEFPSELDAVLVFDPKLDFSKEMIGALDTFLENDGNKGKSFYYFPSATTVDKPNLNEFLEEWGMAYVKDGSGKYATLYTNDYEDLVVNESLKTDYTESSDKMTDKGSITENTLAMERTYETYGARTSTVILQNSVPSYLCPVGSGDDWKPASGATEAVYATAIVTDTDKAGYVVGFGTSMFAESGFNSPSYQNAINNIDIILDVFNTTTGQQTAPFSFTQKKISMSMFTPGEGVSTVFTVIFIALIPIAVAAIGVIVFIRRKNR